MKAIGPAQLPAVPWKNGRGITHAIASDENCRLSLASIEQDCPFSDFSGFDRTIVPCDAAIELCIDGLTQRVERFEAFAFAGEAAVTCRLVAGPTRAFNVMTRRANVRHVVTVENLPAGTAVKSAYALHVLEGVLRAESLDVRAGDTLLDGVGAAIAALEPSVVLRIELAPPPV